MITKYDKQHAKIKLKLHLFHTQAENKHKAVYNEQLLLTSHTKDKTKGVMCNEKEIKKNYKQRRHVTPSDFRCNKVFLIRKILIVLNLLAEIELNFIESLQQK